MIKPFCLFENILIISFVALVLATPAFSKRQAPNDVQPVVQEGVIFRTPEDGGGIIEARRASDESLLWTRQIYVVRYNPEQKKNIQDVFIIKLEFHDDVLSIWTERNFKYELNLDTLVVTAEKGDLVIDQSTRSNG